MKSYQDCSYAPHRHVPPPCLKGKTFSHEKWMSCYGYSEADRGISARYTVLEQSDDQIGYDNIREQNEGNCHSFQWIIKMELL